MASLEFGDGGFDETHDALPSHIWGGPHPDTEVSIGPSDTWGEGQDDIVPVDEPTAEELEAPTPAESGSGGSDDGGKEPPPVPSEGVPDFEDRNEGHDLEAAEPPAFAEPAAEAQPQVFTSEDITVAKRALQTFEREVNRVGLRWEFDISPRAIHNTFSSRSQFSPHAHARELDEFTGRVQAFRQLIHDMVEFLDRPFTYTRPYPRPDNRPTEERQLRTVTRVITSEDIAPLARFHQALVGYTAALIAHGPESPEVAEAAAKAAQLVNPIPWREAGYDIPKNIQPLTLIRADDYLSDLIRQHEQTNPPDENAT